MEKKHNKKAYDLNEFYKKQMSQDQQERMVDCNGMKYCPDCGYLMFQLYKTCPDCGADVRSEGQKENE